jgi:hypothetical protein
MQAADVNKNKINWQAGSLAFCLAVTGIDYIVGTILKRLLKPF